MTWLKLTANRGLKLRRRALRLVFLLLSPLAVSASEVVEPQPWVNPTPPAAAQALGAGKARFESVCSACHGIQARGGRGGAPDLLLSPRVLQSPERFQEFVRAGSPAGGMPGFPFDDQTLNAIQAYLQGLGEVARRRGTRDIAIVGNSQRGKAYFDGSGGCAQCHSSAGDFQHIGTKYNPRVLQGRILLPRGNGVHPGLLALGVRIPGVTDEMSVSDSPRTVTVTDDRGRSVSGVLVSISDFEVALRDGEGRYLSFNRHASTPHVAVQDPAQAHLNRLNQVSDQDLHDLTAYLATLK
jgi:cytochrome c oxidase cbb3-type subunit III